MGDLAARDAARAALLEVLTRRRMVAPIAPRPDLPPAAAARAQRLTLTVLRHLGQLDAVLAPFLTQRPKPGPRTLLLLGAAEMLVDDAAPHGVVHSLVALAKSRPETRRAAGMINAVLRRVDGEGRARWPDLPPQRLPGWMRKPMIKAWGIDAVVAIERAHQAGAQIDLTLAPGAAPEIIGARRLPTGSLRLPPGRQVSDLPGFAEGQLWVQDAAAALPVRLLDDVAGQRVLDLCAAPGGKTMQLAAAGAKVTALDASAARIQRLQENLTRTGLAAEIVVADALDWTSRPFDAVLLDAPCSATGTIRRHPELPFIRDAAAVEALTDLQHRLLDRALDLCAPGGRVVYCTCSLLPNEGENQIRAALGRHDRLRVLPVDPIALGGEAHWQSPEGGLRLRPDFWPDLGGLDGFYMAALTRS